MDERTRYLVEQLDPPPPTLVLSELLDWALARTSGEQAAAIGRLVAHRAWNSDSDTLEPLLPALEALALRVPEPRQLWVHVAHRLDHVAVHSQLARSYDHPLHALENAIAAVRRGADAVDLRRMVVVGLLLSGAPRRALWRLRRYTDLPDHAALWHLATCNTPLDDPSCGCAGHPERSETPPTSEWLKAFFMEGDSLYDAVSSLCLSCHTIWSEDEDSISDTHTWRKVAFERYQHTAGWQLGMDNAWPGDAAMADRASFVRWVRHLPEAAFSYGMV